MTRHHPDDTLLLEQASGSLSVSAAVVVAAHSELCEVCRLKLRDLEALGGVLLASLPPQALSSDALACTLARLDGLSQGPTSPSSTSTPWGRIRATLPPGAQWPRGLRSASTSRWRRLSVGVRWCRVRLPQDPKANAFLVRVAPGQGLPVHSHSGGELTVVLHGAFEDGLRRYARGDFEQADDRTHHRPIASDAGECICLTAIDGRISFDGRLARAVGRLLKI